MAKLLINDSGKALVGDNGKAYAVNCDAVSGTPPLTFTAASGRLRQLLRYGKCVQSGTPTPSSPLAISCNNGVLTVRHKSGLPTGYKLLEYIGSNAGGYIITDLYLASTDIIESEFQNRTTTGYGALYGIYSSGESTALYANQTYYGYGEDNSKIDTLIPVDTDWHSARHDFVNGLLTIDGIETSFTPWTFTNSKKNAILTRYYNNSYGYVFKGYIRKFRVIRSGEVVCDLLPCKNSQDEAGVYDLVSGNFYGATGGALIAGNEVDDNYETVAVGTPEALTLGSQSATVADLLQVGNYMDEQNILTGEITRRIGVKILTGSESWAASDTAGIFMASLWTRNHPNNSRIALVSNNYQGTNAMNADMPDKSVKGGNSASLNKFSLFVKDTTYSSVEDFKAFLATQLAAGTPVIVLYPLDGTTTETVEKQTIETAAGQNTLTAGGDVSLIYNT